MTTKKEVLKSQAGVELKKTTLYQGSLPVDVGYSVSSKRISEVPTFDSQSEAEKYFVQEVALCRGGKAGYV